MDKIELTTPQEPDKIPSVEFADRVTKAQRKYNVVSKNLAYIIGRNLTLFICMLVPMLLVGFIWTDFGAIVIGPRMVSDGILTVALFVVGEIMMTRLGSEGGKLDIDYLSAKSEYEGVLSKVAEVGTILMGVFCDWQIDLELEQTIQLKLRAIRMTKNEWEGVKTLSKEELEQKYGKIKAAQIYDISVLAPIELNEAILLYNDENSKRGGVPISADSYLRSRKHLLGTLIACIFTGLITVAVVLTFTSDVTFARVVYTAVKLVMLLFRMARGYDRGARAYNTIAVRQLKAKTNYLRQYLKFMEDKIYLKLDEKYGDVSCYVGEVIENKE